MTEITLDPNLDEQIHLYRGIRRIPDAERIFKGAQLLIIDDLNWGADLDVIRMDLEDSPQESLKSLTHDHPLYASRELSPEVKRELDKLRAETDQLFRELYPSFKYTVRRESFRPMVLKDAGMHYDHYDGETIVTAYMNIARTPRSYRLGRSFPGIVRDQPGVMKEVMRECKGDLGAISRVITGRTRAGRPPLGGAPTHRIDFGPGAIWFFDAKLVSHQVVYGEGVAGQSWEVPGATKTQRQYVAQL